MICRFCEEETENYNLYWEECFNHDGLTIYYGLGSGNIQIRVKVSETFLCWYPDASTFAIRKGGDDIITVEGCLPGVPKPEDVPQFMERMLRLKAFA